MVTDCNARVIVQLRISVNCPLLAHHNGLVSLYTFVIETCAGWNVIIESCTLVLFLFRNWAAVEAKQDLISRQTYPPKSTPEYPPMQGFTLAEFLKDPRPDVILLFSNSHESFNLSSASNIVERQLRLIDQFVSATTRFVWIALQAEVLEKKPPEWRNKVYYDEKGMPVDRVEWIRQWNEIVFRASKERFTSGRNPMMFLNLLDSSLPVSELNKDGVHWQPIWYRSVTSLVLQSLCNMWRWWYYWCVTWF